MQYKKTTTKGENERIRVLEGYEPGIRDLLADALPKTSRKSLKVDDILDAAVAFVTAEGKFGDLASLAGEPSHDQAGLPIEMLYLKV